MYHATVITSVIRLLLLQLSARRADRQKEKHIKHADQLISVYVENGGMAYNF